MPIVRQPEIKPLKVVGVVRKTAKGFKIAVKRGNLVYDLDRAENLNVLDDFRISRNWAELRNLVSNEAKYYPIKRWHNILALNKRQRECFFSAFEPVAERLRSVGIYYAKKNGKRALRRAIVRNTTLNVYDDVDGVKIFVRSMPFDE